MKKQLSNEERLMTDKAWEKLRTSLESDGLINEPIKRRSPSYRYALAFAATLILVVTAGLFITKNDVSVTEYSSINLLNDIPGTTLVTKLEDGSVVYLAEKTTIKHPDKFSNNERLITLEGEAFFDIARDESKPFIINSGNAKVEVLGTSFELISHSGETVLSVRTGKVRITLISTGMMIDLNAGERAIADNDGVKKLTFDEYQDFQKYRSRMHFKDQTLINVTDILNRNFKDFEIVLEPGIEKRELTATFTEENIESMVQLICNALNLKYTTQGRVIKIHM
jgi:ferric-dicitrate binding protein FerR (iron transport regulator)